MATLPLKIEAEYYVNMLYRNAANHKEDREQLLNLALLGVKTLSARGDANFIAFVDGKYYPE